VDHPVLDSPNVQVWTFCFDPAKVHARSSYWLEAAAAVALLCAAATMTESRAGSERALGTSIIGSAGVLAGRTWLPGR
jgi:hypothetical protein